MRTSQLLVQYGFAICRSTAAALVICGACAAHVVAQDNPALDAKGFQQNRDYFAGAPFENIDTLAGHVILTFTDLVLAGNAGRELRFERTYDSHEFGPQNWHFGIAGMPMRIREKPRLVEPIPHELEVSRSPELEMADGALIKTVFKSSPTTNQDIVVSSHFWEYDRWTRTLRQPDGTTAYYDTALRLDRFSDPYGNEVDLIWGAATLEVRQDLGNGEVRTVTFVINPTTQLPSSMSFEDRTWRYECDGGVPWADCYQLARVVPPVGPGWEFGYVNNPTLPPKVNLVRTPQGGQIAYGWENVVFEPLPGQQQPVTRVAITSRTTGGREIVPGEWRYTYTRWDELPRSTTIVAVHSGTQMTFSYDDQAGNANVMDGGVGLIGKSVGTLESESRTYERQPVAQHPCGTWSLPQLKSRSVRRDGRDYTTTLTYRTTAFGDYHNPHVVTETGATASGTVTRTTTRTFRHSVAAPYILAQVETERVIAGGGDTYEKSWMYDASTGFKLTETVYGITTQFAPDAHGNVASVTKANGKTTNFSYSWGTASQASTPEHTTSRAINPAGTVASETQAGRTTAFTYDPLFRISTTQPPGGTNATVTEYDNDGGEWVRVTRGATPATSSVVTTTFDGFGRPIRTINSLNVETRTAYDADGRETFEGYPFVAKQPAELESLLVRAQQPAQLQGR